MNAEMQMDSLVDFPMHKYLMIRMEYVLLLQNELEAKVLRIIEYLIESERQNRYRRYINKHGAIPPGYIVSIPKDIWVAISFKLFARELYHDIKSRNTLKRAIKELVKKGYIQTRFTAHQYDAPEYMINHAYLQEKLNGLDSKYPKLILSEDDSDCQELTVTPKSRLSKTDSLDCQILTPSMHSTLSNFDTNKEYSNKEEKNKDTLRANLPHGKSSLPNTSSFSNQSLSGTNGKDGGTGNEETREQHPVERVLSPAPPVPYGMKAKRQAEANASIERIRVGIDARAASANEQAPIEPRKPRKTDLTPNELAVADTWDALNTVPMDRTDSNHKAALRYFARVIAEGKATLDDLKRCKDKLEEQDFWQGKVTLTALKKQFQATMTALSLQATPSKDTGKIADSKKQYSSKRVVAPEVQAETQNTFDQWKVDGDAAELRFYLDPDCKYEVPQHMKEAVAQAKAKQEKELVGAV